jgi:hypothetical protein
MSNPANGAPAANLGPLPRHRERAECDARDPVVITRPAAPAGHGIALMECAAAGLDLRTWWERNRGLLHDCRRQHGAVLIRGCHVGGAEVFYALMQALDSRAMTYVERSSPRRLVYGSVYTSTEYPADQSIFPHNENSYAGVWPLHIAF